MSDKKVFSQGIAKVIAGNDLSRAEAGVLFRRMLNNQETEMHQGALLAALAAKGETEAEIAAAWEAIYELDTVKVTPDVMIPIMDNCGTGMDQVKTFNISTAAGILAAAGGVPMAKHGARAITSACGTIDILEELGVDVECDPQLVKVSVERAGIGIFNGMSPKVHPLALGRILSQISFGSILNISASLANPALPKLGVRGVYSASMVELVPRVMREIGYERAMVVHGLAEDGQRGMDEASISNETIVAELTPSGFIRRHTIKPEDFGIARAPVAALKSCEDRTQEAVRLLGVLTGEEQGARADVVCLNAALPLYLSGVCTTMAEGVVAARELIRSGQALTTLKAWVQWQNREPEKGQQRLTSRLAMLESRAC